MKEIPVTLNEVLAARENRAARQREMLSRHGKTLISLTAVMPGSVKRTDGTKFVIDTADGFIAGAFGKNLLERELTDKPTGYEIIYAVNGEPLSVKKITAAFEDEHPLGRLMDMDVIRENGEIVSRSEIGLPPRKCLLCDKPSAYCIRAKTHTVNEVRNRINEMIAAYRNRNQK